jgi:predicted DNA-binding transcriptional regulator AlpA
MSELQLSTTTRRIRVSDDARYLTTGQVRERFGVSDMWVYRYIRDHGFPKPVKFGGPTSARRWRLSEIEQWERERIKAAQEQSISNRPDPTATPTRPKETSRGH